MLRTCDHKNRKKVLNVHVVFCLLSIGFQEIGAGGSFVRTAPRRSTCDSSMR